MSEYFSIIDIECREDGLYYLVATQWHLATHTVARRADLSVSYTTYSQAARGRELAYEMWTYYLRSGG